MGESRRARVITRRVERQTLSSSRDWRSGQILGGRRHMLRHGSTRSHHTCRPAWSGRSYAVSIACALMLGSSTSSAAPSHDPNDAPRMRAPNNQAQTIEHRRLRFDGDPTPTERCSSVEGNECTESVRPRRPSRCSRRALGCSEHASFDLPYRWGISIEPVFSAVFTQFQGRTSTRPIRGGGIGLNVDAWLTEIFGLRLTASHTMHPLEATYVTEDDETQLSARRGVLHSSHIGLGVLYGLDIGRVRPSLELGIGGTLFISPTGVQPGQRNQACRDDGSCDLGLRCDVAVQQCRPTPLAGAFGGASVDVAIHHRFSVGAAIRYFTFLTNPGAFPVYLHGAVRLLAKF